MYIISRVYCNGLFRLSENLRHNLTCVLSVQKHMFLPMIPGVSSTRGSTKGRPPLDTPGPVVHTRVSVSVALTPPSCPKYSVVTSGSRVRVTIESLLSLGHHPQREVGED